MRRVLLALVLLAACGVPTQDQPVALDVVEDVQPTHRPQQADPNAFVVPPPTTEARPKSSPPTTRASRSGARSGAKGRVRPAGGDVWTRLGACESGNNPTAHSPTGRYHGAFQFSLATWHSLGMSGDPHNYPYAVQLEAAKRLQARSGWGQWPACARKLGLI